MADIAKISLQVEVIGEESIDQAITSTNRLERGVNKLHKEYQKGKLTSGQYQAGINQLASKNKTLNRTYQDNLRIASRYRAALIKNDAALDLVSNATDEATRSQNRLNRALINGGNQHGKYNIAAQRSAQTRQGRAETPRQRRRADR